MATLNQRIARNYRARDAAFKAEPRGVRQREKDEGRHIDAYDARFYDLQNMFREIKADSLTTDPAAKLRKLMRLRYSY